MGRDVTRLVGGSAFIFFCRIFGAAVGLLTQVLLARWMGATELGGYVLAYSWLVMLAAVSVSGYNGASMRFIGQGLADDDHGTVRGFLRHATAVVLITSVVVACAAALAVMAVGDRVPGKRTLFFLALAGVPLFALIKLNVGLANAFSRFGLSFLPNNVVRPVLFVVVLWVAYKLNHGLDADLAMWIQIAVMLAVVVAHTILVRWALRAMIRPAPPTYESGLWYRTAFSLLLLGFFTNYFPEFTVVLIGFFLPGADIAIYNAAFRIALLITFGLIAVDAFTAPELVRHYRRGERTELLAVIRHSTRLRFWAALLAVLAFAVLGKPLLSLFGEEFVAGYGVLLILSFGQLAQASVGPAARLLSVTGHQNPGLLVSGAALVICALMITALVPRFGIAGAAVAAFLSMVIWSAGLRALVKHYLDIDTLIFSRA